MVRRSFFKRLISLLIGLALVVSLYGQDKIKELEQQLKANPGDEATLMELGRLYHDQASSGDEVAVDKGISVLDQLLAIDSTNAVAVAYRGALLTMHGRDSWWPPNKLKYMRQGCEELDRAIEMDPGNIMVHLIRGINGLGLPEYAGRLSISLEDFIVLLRRPDFQEQTKELKAVIFYYGGVAYKRADDYDRARELFKRAIGVFPGSDYAKRSQEELRDMGS
jgi:tetratricopeptide (TPR) repeat protein